ncbi:hypothetical protein PybrP1_004211 [[Pythium] brassicae (nom. inval.)]|nr:hypothetical protein PybrP1_004211 [[Pythium] brassicae (nom. inval.)]
MSHRSSAEKKLVVKLYNYFKHEAADNNDPLKRACLHRVADALEIPHVSVSRIVRVWKQNGEFSFVDPPPSRGRPPRALGRGSQEVIASVISSRNLQKMPTTSHHVKNAVLEKTGRLVSDRTVCREFKKMKFTYIQGQQRDPRADKRSSVKCRLQYLTEKRSNPTARQLPKRPEIYLVVSYCNTNHVARKTWIEKGAPRYMTAGAGPCYCIVGAPHWLDRTALVVSTWTAHPITSAFSTQPQRHQPRSKPFSTGCLAKGSQSIIPSS